MTTQLQTTYRVTGMTCGHCELSVQEEVLAVPGVSAATADRASGTLLVSGNPDPEDIAQAVREAGYEVAR